MKRIRSNEKGFSLIEVLVTIILITVGVLGMVAMQGRAIQYTQDSVQRTHAVMLANELVEIIRANPGATFEGAEDSAFFSGSLPEAATGNCREINNSESTLVRAQLSCWGNKVRQLLPGAEDLGDRFYACTSDTPGNCGNGAAVEVQLAWRAVGEECLSAVADATPEICTYRVRTQI